MKKHALKIVQSVQNADRLIGFPIATLNLNLCRTV